MTMIRGLMANYFIDFLYAEIKAKNTDVEEKVIRNFINLLYAEIKKTTGKSSLINAIKTVLENRDAINDNTFITSRINELFHVKLKF